MNKRQAKKNRKKVVYPLVDEFNLLTLNEDEYKKAIEDYRNYCIKHYSYKHYRDKYKILKKPCFYSFPVGEATKKYMEQMLKVARTRNIAPVVVCQSLEQIKGLYE